MRIFKGTETTLNLLFPNACEIYDYDDLNVVLYTTNPQIATLIKDVKLDGNIIHVGVNDWCFAKMDDGVINYIITNEDDTLSIERQSNYYLKTPIDYVPTPLPEELNIGPIEITPEVNDLIDKTILQIVPEGDMDAFDSARIDLSDIKVSWGEQYEEDFYNEGYSDGYSTGNKEGYDEGYNKGNTDGYNRGYEVGNESGYEQGFDDGIVDQKNKLGSINITTNGTYKKEDGYNDITVEVPDLNGSYDDGYEQGQKEGYNQGYTEGYTEGVDDAVEIAGEKIAEEARVLDITENGYYLSKYSDDVIVYPEPITGYYEDGTPFCDYAYLKTKTFDTNMYVTNNTTIEFWFKYTNEWEGDIYFVLMSSMAKDHNQGLQIRNKNSSFYLEIGSTSVNIGTLPTDSWTHILVKQNEGLYVNGELKGTLNISEYTSSGTLCINGCHYNSKRHINGYYGMVKIDDQILIPTEDGFINYNTQTPLNILYEGTYDFYYNPPTIIKDEGNLIKTVNVNVPPRINAPKEGLKFAYSSFKEIPQWVEWDGIINMDHMFYFCNNLQTIPLIDTSSVTNMEQMFYHCRNLQTIPLLDTSSVTNMNQLFYDCSSLTSIPQLDTSKVTNMARMFGDCNNLKAIPPLDARSVVKQSYGLFYATTLNNLTDFGGLIGLKASMDGSFCFEKTPNLTYESCINILNGLYDFVGNAETPASNQGKLKVHQNFLNLVGDEISIGTNKGWTITA